MELMGAVECIDTLTNILALTLGTSVTQTTVPTGSKARPTDVAGCTLEMVADGLWTGNLGTLTQAQTNNIPIANLSIGVSYNQGTTKYSYNGVAWVIDNHKTHSLGTARISANLWDGVEALVDQYIDNDGTIKSMGGYAVSNYVSVNPGDRLLVCNGQSSLDKMGGFYSDTICVSAIGSGMDGFITVPPACNKIRITTRRTNQSDYCPVFIYKMGATLGVKSFSSIASIGDSICRGFKASRPFTSIVANYYGVLGGNVDNNGIDSCTIAHSTNNPISERMTQLNSSADLILFEGGGNDFNLIPVALGTISDTTNSTFYGALNLCATYLCRNFPFATIVWITVPRWSNWSVPNSQSLTMDAYMEAFKSVAIRNGFIVADGYSQLSIAAYPRGRLIASDYAHLNDLGHQLLSDIIIRAIE